MKKNKFNVEGIHCGSCVSKIEKGLGTLDGFLTGAVDREAGVVFVESEDTLSPMTIKTCIEDLGFRVSSFSKE